jgi:hypothetical protein
LGSGDIITVAERRFPDHIKVAVPPAASASGSRR